MKAKIRAMEKKAKSVKMENMSLSWLKPEGVKREGKGEGGDGEK